MLNLASSQGSGGYYQEDGKDVSSGYDVDEEDDAHCLLGWVSSFGSGSYHDNYDETLRMVQMTGVK